MELYNEDCLERLKEIPDKSIDLIFNDLPYGILSTKWDSLIDIDELWKQYKRIRKDTTPIFFTCTTKFGNSLINSNMKEFRYDLIWVKSAACGFLNAKKMPMRKHEMIYVFYKKLPFYNLESHKHKFIKEGKKTNNDVGNECYGKFTYYNNGEKGYDPPLPVSVIKEDTTTIKTDLYSSKNKKDKRELKREPAGKYDPPLPVSVIKETQISKKQIAGEKNLYGNMNGGTIGNIKGSNYEPPLPNSILEIKSQKGKHSTQKPDALMEWILKYYSKEDYVVLDPTMGSGSMGVACKKMNRKFIGIEKDKDIFKVAEERIN